MQNKSLVSVIVPVYKTPEKYLRSCIESVLKQTITDFELILVDDGSPDDCGKICDEYAANDSRIKVIHQKNAGVSKARNAGLECATGKYLTFLDSDDLLVANAWEIVVKVMEEEQTDCVVFGWNDFDANGKNPHKVSETRERISAEEAMFQIASDNFLCGGGYPWNKMWNAENIRNAYGKLTQFSELVYTYEDKLWIIETLDKLNSVVLIPDMLYEYRFLPESLTNSEEGWRKRQFNAYDAYDMILEKVKGRKKAYRGALKFYFYFCYTDLKNMYPYRKNDMERYRDTKKRLVKICRRAHLGDFPNYKYYLAWAYYSLFGWL